MDMAWDGKPNFCTITDVQGEERYVNTALVVSVWARTDTLTRVYMIDGTPEGFFVDTEEHACDVVFRMATGMSAEALASMRDE